LVPWLNNSTCRSLVLWKGRAPARRGSHKWSDPMLTRREFLADTRCTVAQPTIPCCWPAMAIPESTCTAARASRQPIRWAGRCPATRFCKRGAKLRNRLPRIRILFYTPIATFGLDYRLEPVAYGLKFAGSFSAGILLKTALSAKLQAAGVNGTAYAAKLPGGQTSLILLNKEALADETACPVSRLKTPDPRSQGSGKSATLVSEKLAPSSDAGMDA
jgi:hypothetical protein